MWQEDSHGSFLITREAFQRIAAHMTIFPSFFDIIRGFGYRSRASDEDSSGYARRLSGTRNERVLGMIWGLKLSLG